MSIHIAEREAKPSIMNGIPCSICIRIERLRQLINKAQLYLDNQFTKKQKQAFLKRCSKEAVLKARVRYDLLRDKQYSSRILQNLIRSELNFRWKKELARCQIKWQRTKRLDMLRQQLSKLTLCHPRCAACKICFGEEHMESPHASPIGDLCSVCIKCYTKQGHDTFVKRIPRMEDE